jgi:hypothetical protein
MSNVYLQLLESAVLKIATGHVDDPFALCVCIFDIANAETDRQEASELLAVSGRSEPNVLNAAPRTNVRVHASA